MHSPRRHARSVLVCLIGALLPLVAPAQAHDAEAALVESFYRYLLESPASGLPDAARLESLRAFISPALAERFALAEQAQARCIAAARDGDKPLMLEHDLLLGTSDAAHEIAYGARKRSLHQQTQAVRLVGIDTRFGIADPRRVVIWSSEVVLRRARHVWRIDDIRFSQGPTLRAELLEYITVARRSCRPADPR